MELISLERIKNYLLISQQQKEIQWEPWETVKRLLLLPLKVDLYYISRVIFISTLLGFIVSLMNYVPTRPSEWETKGA